MFNMPESLQGHLAMTKDVQDLEIGNDASSGIHDPTNHPPDVSIDASDAVALAREAIVAIQQSSIPAEEKIVLCNNIEQLAKFLEPVRPTAVQVFWNAVKEYGEHHPSILKLGVSLKEAVTALV